MRALALLLVASAAFAETYPSAWLGGTFGTKHSRTIAIFAEGWTKEEIDAGTFFAVAKGAASGLFKIPPYDLYENYIRVIAVGTPSTDAGVRRLCSTCERYDVTDPKDAGPSNFIKKSDPRYKKFMEKESYFSSTLNATVIQGRGFDKFNSVQIPEEGMDKLEKLLDEYPCDYAILLYNERDLEPEGRYFPKGEKGCPVSMVAMNVGGSIGRTAAHELGHSMFGLGDEKYNPSNSCSGVKELPFPNASIYNDSKVKWAHLVPCLGPPVYPAMCDRSYKPTKTCLMNADTLEAPFCDVCLSAMTIKVGELASLIQYTEPGGPVVTGVPSGSWIFKVHTRGTEKSDYTGCWFIDGKSMGEGTKTASRNGPRFELAFSVKTGFFDLGVHEIRFSVVNNQQANNDTCGKFVGKTPNVKRWFIVAAPGKLGIPLLESSESWD